jgi:hypothetical protein
VKKFRFVAILTSLIMLLSAITTNLSVPIPFLDAKALAKSGKESKSLNKLDKLWEYDAKNSIHAGPVLGPEDDVYIVESEENDSVTDYTYQDKLLGINEKGKASTVYEFGSYGNYGKEIVFGRDGTAYLKDVDTLLAVKDGKKKWDYTFDGWFNYGYRPVVDEDGNVYIVNGNTLYAFDSKGKIKWTYPDVFGYDLTFQNQTLYLMDYKGFVAIDPDGEKKWEHVLTEDYLFSHPRPFFTVGSDGTLYGAFSTYEGETNITVIAPSGEVKEEFTLNDENTIEGIELGKNETVYLALGNDLYAYQLDGKKKWKIELDYVPNKMESDKNGMLYVITSGSLFSISPEGSITWKLTDLNYYFNFALGNDGVIYVSDGDTLTAYKTDNSAEEKKVKALSVNKKSLSITKGKSAQLELTATYDDNSKEKVTALAEWSSSNSDVATVEKGVVKAKNKVKTTVKAKYGNKTISISVTVK